MEVDSNHSESGQLFIGEILAAGESELTMDSLNTASDYFENGKSLFEQEKWREAEAAFRRAIELKDDWADAHYELGRALDEQEKWREAEAAFRRAIELNGDPFSYLYLGVVLKRQEKWCEAEDAYRKAVAKAEKEYRPELIKAEKDHPDGGVELEKLKSNLSGYLAECHYLLGHFLGEREKLAEAASEFRRAADLDPKFEEAHFYLGVALYLQGKYAVAEVAYNKAIKLRCDWPEAYYGLGLALEGQEKHIEAEKQYRKAIDLKSDYVDARIELADLHRKVGFPEAAEMEALEVKKTHYNFWRVRNTLAEIYIDQGDASGDLNWYRDAIRELEMTAEFLEEEGSPQEQHNNMPFIHLNRGYAYARLGKRGKAIDEFTRCLEMRSKGPISRGDPFTKARNNLRELTGQNNREQPVPDWLPYALTGFASALLVLAVLLLRAKLIEGKQLVTLILASLVVVIVGFYLPYVTKLKFGDILELEKDVSIPATAPTDFDLEHAHERL
jgi:tetratricopeptide (TPR) repeat protein